MIFYPKKYFGNILEITVDFLQNNQIEGILLDIDNTIIDKDNKIIEGLEKWVENIKKNNIKICILSNTNRKSKAQKLSKLIDCNKIILTFPVIPTVNDTDDNIEQMIAFMKSCKWVESVSDCTLYGKSLDCLKITAHGVEVYTKIRDR